MEIRRTIPVFRIFDVAKAREFYEGWLGFRVAWVHNERAAPQYIEVARGGLVLHLTEHHGDCTPGALAFVEVEGLAAFHEEIMARDYRYNRPGLDPAPWGGRVVEVTDPFGNRLRLWER